MIDRRNKTAGNLGIVGLAMIAVVACSTLFAQTQDTKPVSKPSTPSVQPCDSLAAAVQGESIADAARRLRAFKDCIQGVSKKAAGREITSEWEKGTDARTQTVQFLGTYQTSDAVHNIGGNEQCVGSETELPPPSRRTPAEARCAAALRADTGPGAVYVWSVLANGDLESDWKDARTLDVYGGEITLADRIVASHSGQIKSIAVRIRNTSQDALNIKFSVECGEWSKEEDIVIEPNETLEGPSVVQRRVWRSHYGYDGQGNPLTSYVQSRESEYHNFTYTPENSCNSVTLGAFGRDVQPAWR
jgi:hypothetical protein